MATRVRCQACGRFMTVGDDLKFPKHKNFRTRKDCVMSDQVVQKKGGSR